MRRPTRSVHHRPAMQTLERLHSELGCQILENKKQAKKLAQQMIHVEAVLKMLQPGYDVRPIAVKRRTPNPWFKRGTLFRSAVDVLRSADSPMTAREITLRMLSIKRVKDPDPKAVAPLVLAVVAAMRNHKGGRVVSVGTAVPPRWALAS